MTRRGWILFVSLGVIWGLPYLLIKVAVESVEPSFIVFVRVALGAAILIPIVVAKGQLGSLRGHWRWALAFALVEVTFTFLALGWAEQRISSSLAALLISTVPIVGALLARQFGLDDQLNGRRVAGLAIGFLGVGALVGFDVEGGDLLSVAAVGITVLGYSLGPIIIEKRLSDVPSLPVISAALAINTLIYAPVAYVTHPAGPVPMTAWLAMIVLGVLCTAVAFVLLFALIGEVGAPRAQVITYVNPAVAVVLGVAILSEPITIGIAVGFPLVLAGSWLATRSGPYVEAEPHP